MTTDHLTLFRQLRSEASRQAGDEQQLPFLSSFFVQGDLMLFLMNALIFSIGLSFLITGFVLFCQTW